MRMRPHLQLGRYTLEYWHDADPFWPLKLYRLKDGGWYALWFGKRIRIGRNPW